MSVRHRTAIAPTSHRRPNLQTILAIGQQRIDALGNGTENGVLPTELLRQIATEANDCFKISITTPIVQHRISAIPRAWNFTMRIDFHKPLDSHLPVNMHTIAAILGERLKMDHEAEVIHDGIPLYLREDRPDAYYTILGNNNACTLNWEESFAYRPNVRPEDYMHNINIVGVIEQWANTMGELVITLPNEHEGDALTLKVCPYAATTRMRLVDYLSWKLLPCKLQPPND
jgi:hypothetical protein